MFQIQPYIPDKKYYIGDILPDEHCYHVIADYSVLNYNVYNTVSGKVQTVIDMLNNKLINIKQAKKVLGFR
jgi:hypothetical protein